MLDIVGALMLVLVVDRLIQKLAPRQFVACDLVRVDTAITNHSLFWCMGQYSRSGQVNPVTRTLACLVHCILPQDRTSFGSVTLSHPNGHSVAYTPNFPLISDQAKFSG